MTGQDLFAVFTAYNQSIWPAQLALIALALALVVASVSGARWSGRVVYGGLAVLWAWCGAVFFLAFFAPVMRASYVVGPLFLLQAILFGRAAGKARPGAMALHADIHGLVGTLLIAYALFAYPVLASALGQRYPAQPTFGAPCPLTIFTFGVLLLETGAEPVHLLVIPFLWSLFGILPVVRFGVLEDIGLPVAGLLGLGMILVHNRRMRAASLPGGVGETPAPMEGTGRLH